MTAPTFNEALSVWSRIGVLSFGGPAAQIALMHREIVDKKGWLTENQFLNALSFCMLLPGPEAMQLATYAGWRLHGVAGGLAAGLMFVLPGAVVILALASIYAAFGSVPLIAALFLGVKATVVVIVIEALLKVAKRALKGTAHWALAGLAFVAIFAFAIPFPIIILAAALAGVLLMTEEQATSDVPVLAATPLQTAKTVAIWLLIWWIPLLLLFFAPEPLAEIGTFFSKLAVVTFGGAYAVLAYMAQDVVDGYGWLSTGQMMDGLGLAETTPGPLILVTEFVGFLAGYQSGGWLLAVLAAIVTLWATFVPCFLWIFAGAPYIEWIATRPRLKAALAGITAAVVGVILNLSLWFALHVFFGEVHRTAGGPLQVWYPDLLSLNVAALLLAVGAGYLLLVRHWPIIWVLGIAAGAAVVLSLIGLA